MNVFVIGVGLIGGSMVLDIQREYPEAIVYGIDTNEEHLKKALEIGVIQQKATFSDLKKATIVIISVPVDIQLEILPKILNLVTEDCLVLDVGSTKAQVCEIIKNHPKRRNFLATHPIAGTEFSGPTAAHQNLFQQKTNIICEVEKTAFKLQEKALAIFSKLGMRIRYMDAKSHDKHIAYVSHLSHISSFMLGKTVINKEKNERDIFDMAGSGFASTVRLAKSSPAMWTPIFKQNKENVIETLDEYIHNLQQFKKLMLQDDFTKIYDEMESTNHIKKILNGIK
ncbi:prephenate dehydrogenase [Tenacibaculum soleae]|uniref:Prephenate dehydrogenase n=1 Tax=Tenacibaculum soleae TaxID=447689 RepID=A0A1B9Y2W8_9FLAO|nr:prephenate dehydrogenase [Tenacibaculum soleae]MDO6745379.1 prephenate dehydrogenase [Tenacibaculum soleae]MDO6812936.1 prephenate dehydrogenase [Tenacibaculum soleae]OCK44041.1 prephenate dehydrogenase [Tenacibaculum soleae]